MLIEISKITILAIGFLLSFGTFIFCCIRDAKMKEAEGGSPTQKAENNKLAGVSILAVLIFTYLMIPHLQILFGN